MIGLISDTHEHARMIVKAVEIFKQKSPDLIIHCGDIISPPTLERFAGLPMRFIFGNNDGERSGLRKKCLELQFGNIDDTLELEYQGKKLFAYHGTVTRELNAAISSGKYDYVFHGHTHEVRDEMVGKTRVINPGALFDVDEATIVFLDIPTGDLEVVSILP